MGDKSRYALFQEMIGELDEAFNLVNQYDSMLHDYNGVILYQAESQLIKLIGNFPGISAAECARILKKSLSACSQLIKKLRKKEWIAQERNELNNRVYNLYLTDSGKEIYRNHKKFEEKCYRRTYKLLHSFTEEEFRTFLKIQEAINIGFRKDIEDGKGLILDSKQQK
jgi:Transcriptional regulators